MLKPSATHLASGNVGFLSSHKADEGRHREACSHDTSQRSAPSLCR